MELPPEIPNPKCQTERLDASHPADVARAAQILSDGGTVAFPTETVYGLGANALSEEAVEKIFIAKRRPHWDPLIVHIASKEMLAQVWDENTAVILSGASQPHRDAQSKNPDAARVTSTAGPFPTSNLPALASRYPEAVAPGLSNSANEKGLQPLGYAVHTVQDLMNRFWPGPLTLLLQKVSAIPDSVTANRPLVGVRMPAHPVALDLIRQAGIPIAAPSANLFGHTSPTTAAHVLADLDGRIDAVLDGGPTGIGLESTVVEVTNQGVRIYRPGAIDAGMLETVVDWAEPYVPGVESPSKPASQPSPGLDLRHYAPHAKLILVSDKTQEATESSLVDAIDRAYDGIATIGVMLPDRWNPSCAQLTYPWGDWRDGETLAHHLFAGLRDLDDRGATVIVCPLPTIPGIGEAIRDRLQKAARPR